MSWALISDSSCNLRDWQPTAPHTTFAFAPLKIRVGEREFVDDLSLDVHELNVAIQSEAGASSSACPSVGEWAEICRADRPEWIARRLSQRRGVGRALQIGRQDHLHADL